MATNARIADLRSSSCFSNSCLTAFDFNLAKQVSFNKPTIFSNPK